MDNFVVHRPRNVDWKRAAGLLYGDWGTSKAYVLGLAFVAAGFSSMPIILAVCVLTALVAYNYVVICRNFPDGGGVYSAARDQSRLLAVMGALLLVADLTVTAALSGWAALSYFGCSEKYVGLTTLALILIVGVVNFFGPKHSGSIAVTLAVPMIVVILMIIGFSVPYLTTAYLEPSHENFQKNWIAFIKVILALSGVEAIANLTGVMKLDRGSFSDQPRIGRTAARSIAIVAFEVVIGTALLGWAMLSLPHDLSPQLIDRKEDMLRFLGEQYGTRVLGPVFGGFFGIVIGIVVGLLLLSAVNTAIVALIGLIYMMARDGEMPKKFTKLNSHGVPIIPLLIAIGLPFIVVALTDRFSASSQDKFEALANLYAIGVVGAIAVNLGSCTFNQRLKLHWFERGLMGVTFMILFAVELTIAKTKPDALFFACCVVGVGLWLRGHSQKQAGLETVVVHRDLAAAISPNVLANLQLKLKEGQKIMVAARGLTPVVRFALEEARLRKGALYVLYVKELAVSMPAPLIETSRPRWQDDPQAASIMYPIIELAKPLDVTVVPLFAISEDPATTIVDLSATLGIDFLMLGSSNRRFLLQVLKGDIINEVARNLPENIQLIIHS